MAVERITTVLAPAASYDLTDLATVHDELSIPANDVSNDAFLSRAITQASDAIASFCNRKFQVETVQDQIFIQQDAYPFQVPGGVDPLQLSRWPLVNSAGKTFTGNLHLGTQEVDGIQTTAGLEAGMLVFTPNGELPQPTYIVSVDGINAIKVSEVPGVQKNGVTFTTGVQVIQTLSSLTTQMLNPGTDYTVDEERGWLIRLNNFTGVNEKWEAEPLTVIYQAGYETIPAALVDACLRLVTARFKQRGRDPLLIERTQPAMGTERFWVSGTSAGTFREEIEGLLVPYRVPVVT